MDQNLWTDWSDQKYLGRRSFSPAAPENGFLGQKISSNPLAAKQRNVAQQRRRLETEEFQKLSAVLPISRAISEQHIDKTTIVRLASSYIKLHHLLGLNYSQFGSYDPYNGSLIDIVDGFLLVLSDGGDILYVSETISLHLGLSQVEMTGNMFWNYLHQADAADFQRFLKSICYSFSVASSTFRIKSTLTKRSTKDLTNPNAGYRPIQITISCCTDSNGGGLGNSRYIVAYCQPHLSVLGNTLKLNNDVFILTTDFSLKLLYVDPQILTFLSPRYQPLHLGQHETTEAFEGIGQNWAWTKGVNLYNLVSPDDAYALQDVHQKLFKYPSIRSPLIKFISTEPTTCFTVEIFALSNSTNVPTPNQKNGQADHFILMCTFIG